MRSKLATLAFALALLAGCASGPEAREYQCPRCHAPATYDAKTCPTCGLVFDAPEPKK